MTELLESGEEHGAHQADGPVIAQVEVFPVQIPIVRTFVFATGSPGKAGESSRHVFVRITDSDGCYGWGEGHPLPGWSGETPESVLATLRHYVSRAIIGHPVHDRLGLHRLLDRALGRAAQPIARCAIDVALHDLISRRAGMPLRALLGGSYGPKSLPLSYTMTDVDDEAITQTVEEQRAQGFAHFNFKVGVEPDRDIDIARVLRRAAGPEAFLWADANQSLDLISARPILRAYEELGINLLEQPLPKEAQLTMTQLRGLTKIPLSIDEASVTAADYLRYVSFGLVDYLCLKLTRSGGILPSLQQAAIATAAHQRIIASGLVDSLLTRVATAHVAAALNIAAPMAVNGGQFLDESRIFPDLDRYEKNGRIHLGHEPGIGVVPEVDALLAASFGDG